MYSLANPRLLPVKWKRNVLGQGGRRVGAGAGGAEFRFLIETELVEFVAAVDMRWSSRCVG